MDNRQSGFIVTIDLSKFYSDHRKTAKILVKKEFKTIVDLKHHIKQIFGIREFFLTVGGHFLPDLEDIEILGLNEERICVIPLDKRQLLSNEDQLSTNGYPSVNEKPTFKKNSLDVIEEESTPYLKKGKKRKSLENDDRHRKKEKNRKINAVERNDVNHDTVENATCVERPTDVDTKNSKKSVLNSSHHKISKADPVSTISSPTDTNNHQNSNSKGNLFQSSETCVRLSRHNDTPIKMFKYYVPPKQITKEYLSKNKVNIVKIDIIDDCDVIISDSNSNPSDNYVKTVVDKFEKLISPDKLSETAEIDSEKNSFSQTEASNYTKIYLSQKDANLSFTSQPHTDSDTEIAIVEKETSATDLSSTSNKNDFDVNSQKKSVFLDGYQNNNDQKIPEVNKQHGDDSGSQELKMIRKQIVLNYKRFDGVGHVLEQLKDTDFPQSVESDVSNINKRKRVRKRKRPSHNKSNLNELTGDSQVYFPPNPQKSIALKAEASNSHVRFENNDSANTIVQETQVLSCSSNEELPYTSDDKDSKGVNKTMRSDIFIGGTIVSTPLIKDSIIIDDDEKVVIESKSIFALEHIQKSPLMTGILEPKVGDFIAFKILKLSEDCTPQPSDYIIGEVKEYFSENKTVRFKIIRGVEEFSTPSIRHLAAEPDVSKQQDSSIKELEWPLIVEARLLYP